MSILNSYIGFLSSGLHHEVSTDESLSLAVEMSINKISTFDLVVFT